MRHKRAVLQVAMIGLISVVTAGCSWMPKQSDEGNAAQSSMSQPTEAQVNVSELDAANVAGTTATDTADAGHITTTLYFKDPNGMVAPVTMDLPNTTGIAQEALSYMVQGGPEMSMLPQGFTALLPQGTAIQGMNIADKTGTVAFSKQFENYKAEDERKILEAVTWTLTGFPTIDQVNIWVDGKALNEMPVANTPINGPLSRAMGINIEPEPGVDFGQSMPVTLYFMNETPDQFTYYVPVTRMIALGDQPAMAAMEQLIQGPEAGDGLLSALNSGLQVQNVQLSNGLISADFNDKLLDADKKAPAQEMQSILLSLLANTDATKAQITVNGQSEAISTDNQNYSKPVTLPQHINAVKM